MDIRDVRLADIRPNPNNPRRSWEGLEKLGESIERFGLYYPLTVVEDGGVYRLLDGERRFRAMRDHTALEEAPCRVLTPMEAADESVLAMVGNSNRAELTEEEAARGVQQMMYLGVDEDEARAASGAEAEDVAAMARASALMGARERKAREQNAIWSRPSWQMTFGDARRIAEVADSEDDAAELLHAAENGDRDAFMRAYWDVRARREVGERREASLASVAESGAALVDWDEYQAMEYGEDYVRWIGSSSVTKSGCGCDGFSAAVSPSTGRVEWFCAKPANHAEDRAESEHERAERERREAWAEAAGRRREWVLGEISGIDGTARLNPWVQRAVVGIFSDAFEQLAGEGNPGGLPRDFRTCCLAAAMKAARGSLHQMETESSWSDDLKRSFLEMLETFEGLGYRPSDMEREVAAAARRVLDSRDAEEGE